MSGYVGLTGPQPTVIPAVFNVAASAAAGTVVTGQLYAFGPNVGPLSTVVVPINEVWSIYDIYIIGSYTPDAQLVMYVNGYQQNIMPNLNSMNLNSNTRWKLAETFKLPPASTFSVAIVLLGANGSSAQTYYVYFAVVRAPYVPAK